MTSRRITAVFFDVDFTLIYPGPTFQGDGYASFCGRHGISHEDHEGHEAFFLRVLRDLRGLFFVSSRLDVMELRDLKTLGDFRNVVELERTIWGVDYDDVVSVPILVVTVKRGGVLIGAFDHDRLIAFV